MSTLSFQKVVVTVGSNDPAKDLMAIANSRLAPLGYTGIKYEGHIFAEKNGCLVDAFVLEIKDYLYWLVVLCVGPTQPIADGVRDEIFQIAGQVLNATGS